MTIFGLDETAVEKLVRAVTVEPDARLLEIRDRFARASWTGIAEPGDRIAGELVALFGAPAALQFLVDSVTRDELVGRARAKGSEITEAEMGAALDRWTPRVRSAIALTSFRQAAALGVKALIPGDSAWPSGVDDLGVHGPIALWLRGNASTLGTLNSSISLVGARAATGYGEHVTMEASAGLVDRGYTVVSGAAYGIDGMAHRAALASRGQTVAFLAGGVDRFYPSGHDGLLGRIVESGAVVSELPCGSPPTKWRFLQRNRLIAASSLATIVLEAGWRSGSLNTAGHAAALGRPIGAVPGPVTSAASAGCHRLIREFDARLVTNVDEMAELAPLGEFAEHSASDAPPRSAGPRDRAHPADRAHSPDSGRSRDRAHSPERMRVLDALSERAPRDLDDIARRSGLAVASVQSVLGTLNLDGTASEREKGWVRSRAG